ncbi:hypothetical protein RBG61_09620 [Paludicola sp. MB14-C6]|uniref:hypothetical protein n=1 Tax=Paludihabitans sp. MB14-C6 TaxID=3070656 RepID=UPI0027DBE711|nr:hypothetical protein [Paludicola sp. MB14-C6]WMJ22246.1 hypothetical protein RBG61_09620 [Paludicola sp. MB14-C6]
MRELLNNKKFIIAVRVIGWINIIILIIDIIIFNQALLDKVPSFFKLFGFLAVYMANYKYDWKKVSTKKRIIFICIDILIIVLCSLSLIIHT